MMHTNFLIFRRSTNSCFNPSNPIYKTSSLVSFLFYSSKSQNPNSHLRHNQIQNQNPNPANVDDVPTAELKAQIDRFYKGDSQAIPTIFESILKRKLAGKHEDSDDELMNEFRSDNPDEVSDKEFDSSSNSDTDSESDK